MARSQKKEVGKGSKLDHLQGFLPWGLGVNREEDVLSCCLRWSKFLLQCRLHRDQMLTNPLHI